MSLLTIFYKLSRGGITWQGGHEGGHGGVVHVFVQVDEGGVPAWDGWGGPWCAARGGARGGEQTHAGWRDHPGHGTHRTHARVGEEL